MSIDFKSDSAALHDHRLKSHREVFEVAITGNATPADKGHSSDIPGVAILRSLGKTADADAAESLTWTTPVDATNGLFGVLFSHGKVNKVKKVTVSEQTSTGSGVTVTGPNAGSSYLTAGKNIGIEITSTGSDLASESPTFLVEIEYDAE
jgi:hypothetical protein